MSSGPTRPSRLSGEGVRAYLDIGGVVAAAKAARCDAVHPGYGFLSENPAFGRRLPKRGSSSSVRRRKPWTFGDKARARTLARSLGLPVVEGTDRATSLEEAEAFLAALGPRAAIVLKALAGGGGRGMRVVDDPAKLKDAYARCRSEALTAFGRGELYVERLIQARAPCRSAGRRRRAVGRGVQRSRMHPAAPPSEADRDRAGACRSTRPFARASSRRRSSSPARRNS